MSDGNAARRPSEQNPAYGPRELVFLKKRKAAVVVKFRFAKFCSGLLSACMKHWLMKSEPDVFSLAHLQARPGGVAPWDGVRNYQARNFMRDEMRPGDRVLFYYSSCEVPGVAGI